MSVQSTARYAGPFAGNAVATVFAFAFKVFATTDVVVLQTVIATGAVSNPINGADYTVALNADQTANPGGTITFAVAPPATVSFYITSGIPKAQASSFPNPGPWNPTTAENAWDKSMAVIQEIDQAALKFAPGDVASTHVLPSPAARKNTVIGFDGSGVLAVNSLAGFALASVVAGQIAFGGAANMLTQDAALVWDNVNKRQGIGVAVPTVALDVLGTGKFSTSVAAPLLTTSGAVNLGLGTNGATQWSMVTANGDLVPGNNVSSLGGAANLVKALFTPIIDSGTTGSLSLRTNNGKQQALIVSAGDGTNFASIQGASSPFAPVIFSNGGDANIGLIFGSKGSGPIDFTTGGTFSGDINSGRLTQAQVLHVAGATRALTFSGSAGGNPVIDVTAGALKLSGGTTDIQWGKANVALGGGAAPTVGTIGGTGPAAAAQRNWLRFIESDGTASFIPVWR